MNRIILSFLLIAYSFLPGFAQSWVIKEISGTVELTRSEASPFVAANIGDQVGEDTVISTGFKSSALVEVGSTLIAVHPLTRLTLTEIRSSEGAETLNVNLQAGRVGVELEPPAGTRASMSVTSPMAVAAVRGTSFEFDTRALKVNTGQVSFKGSAGQRITINAGSSIQLRESGRVQNPVLAGSSALRPQAPAGTDQNAAPATIGAIENETPGPSPGPGDVGYIVEW